MNSLCFWSHFWSLPSG